MLTNQMQTLMIEMERFGETGVNPVRARRRQAFIYLCAIKSAKWFMIMTLVSRCYLAVLASASIKYCRPYQSHSLGNSHWG